VPVLALGEYHEGWGFLSVEGTQRLIVPAALLQRNVGRDDLDDIEAFLDLVNYTH
jgi:hypothetical protein